MKLDWTCIEPGHHQYSIERMRAEPLNPHPWNITGPEGWGREAASLVLAKEYCQERENASDPPPSRLSRSVLPGPRNLESDTAIFAKKREAERLRYEKQVAKSEAQINARLGIKSPTRDLKGGVEGRQKASRRGSQNR